MIYLIDGVIYEDFAGDSCLNCCFNNEDGLSDCPSSLPTCVGMCDDQICFRCLSF